MKRKVFNILEKFDYRNVPILFLPILLISGPFLSEISIIFLDMILIHILFKNKNNIELRLLKNNLFLLLLAFYVYLLISNLLLSNFKNFINYFFYIRIVLFSFSIFYLLKLKILKEKNLFKILEITIIIFVLDLLVQYYFGYNLIGIEQQHHTRISGFFGHELIAGSFLLKIFPIYLYLYIVQEKKDKKKIFIFLFTLILFISGVMLSNERTSFYLMIMLLICLCPIMLKQKSFNKKNISLLALIIVMSGYFFFKNNIEAKDRIFYQTYNNIFLQDKIIIFTKDHDAHIRSAWKMFLNKPVLGQGVKKFRDLCNKEKFNINSRSCTTHPHNFAIQLLSETGLIGFIIFYTFVFSICYLTIKEVLNYKKKSKNFSPRYQSLYILALSILVNFFPLTPNGNFFNNWLSIMIFLPLGFWLYNYDLITRRNKIEK